MPVALKILYTQTVGSPISYWSMLYVEIYSAFERIRCKKTIFHYQTAQSRSLTSLSFPLEQKLKPCLPAASPSSTLNRLHGCTGWSESSMDAEHMLNNYVYPIFLVLYPMAWGSEWGVWYSLFIKILAHYSSHWYFGLFIKLRPIIHVAKKSHYSLFINCFFNSLKIWLFVNF